MRISDWSSDVCSSDLFRRSYKARRVDAFAVDLELDLRGPSEAAEAADRPRRGAAHGCAAFSAGAGCPLGKSRRLREPGAQHRARRRGVLSLRQVSLHKQRKVARAVTARKLLIFALRLSGKKKSKSSSLRSPPSSAL